MSRQKNPNNIYWTSVEDQSVLEYLAEVDETRRNYIFTDKLYTPLTRLSEAVFNSCGNFSHLVPANAIVDGVAFMHKILTQFDSSRGKIFSFLTFSCKRYFIGENTKAYNSIKGEVSIDVSYDEHGTSTFESLLQESIVPESMVDDEIELTELLYEKWPKMIEWYKSSHPKHYKDKEEMINRVSDLIYKRVEIPFYNRKNASGGRSQIWMPIKTDKSRGTPQNQLHRIVKLYNQHLRAEKVMAPTLVSY